VIALHPLLLVPVVCARSVLVITTALIQNLIARLKMVLALSALRAHSVRIQLLFAAVMPALNVQPKMIVRIVKNPTAKHLLVLA